MNSPRPVIGIIADRRVVGKHPFQMAGEKYVHAIAKGANALPMILPVLPEPLEAPEVLASVDALLFTGSPSNVEPARYGGEPSHPGTLHDPERDATSLPLITAAVASGVPLLGVCRGFQEMNVAFGGTLWQRVHEVPGFADHRDNEDDPLDKQYAPAHEVLLEPRGILQALAGADRITVNSLHSQGVRDLAPGLAVEARAPDGLIEAFRVTSARAFAVAVQWHPEWRVMANKFSLALFAALGQAARQRHATGRVQG